MQGRIAQICYSNLCTLQNVSRVFNEIGKATKSRAEVAVQAATAFAARERLLHAFVTLKEPVLLS